MAIESRKHDSLFSCSSGDDGSRCLNGDSSYRLLLGSPVVNGEYGCCNSAQGSALRLLSYPRSATLDQLWFSSDVPEIRYIRALVPFLY